MGYYFIDCGHESRMYQLMSADGTHAGDTERVSLFYIISGNEDLYSKRHAIYDFQEHCIKPCLKSRKVDFSSGMRALVRLGFNLYNGYRDRYTAPLDVFCCLDGENRRLAGNAICLRFSDSPPFYNSGDRGTHHGK